jgi:hypothetical protein
MTDISHKQRKKFLQVTTLFSLTHRSTAGCRIRRPEFRSSPELPFPSLHGLNPVFQRAFSSLYSNDSHTVCQSLISIRLLSFPAPDACEPSFSDLRRIVELQSFSDSDISLQATSLLCFFFVRFPAMRAWLFETAFFLRILDFLDRSEVIVFVRDILKNSSTITGMLEEVGLVGRLLEVLGSTANDQIFAFALEVYEFLVTVGVYSAGAVLEEVVELLSPIAVNDECDRQGAVLVFLKSVIGFCGHQLAVNGTLGVIVRGCLGFCEADRAIALGLLAGGAKCGLAEVLIECGAIAMVHHALALGDDDRATTNSKCDSLSVLSGIISSDIVNARAVVRGFLGSEIVDLFSDGNVQEKCAAADIFARLTAYVADPEIADYFAAFNCISLLASMVGTDVKTGLTDILGALLFLRRTHEAGQLSQQLTQQLEATLIDAEFSAAIDHILTSDDSYSTLTELAAGLLAPWPQ